MSQLKKRQYSYSNQFKKGCFLLWTLLIFSSCNGQKSTTIEHEPTATLKTLPISPLTIEVPFVDSILEFRQPVRSIFEDSKGNFWFGTQSEGVCCYDGKTYTYFTTKQGLCNNQVRTIQEDEQGRIWFGTGGGVCFFDGKNILTLSINSDNFMNLGISKSKENWNTKRPDNKFGLNQIWKNTPNALWFDAGMNNGAYQYDGEKFTYFAFPISEKDSLDKHSFGEYMVYSIHKDSNGNIWFGTQNQGVIRYDGESFLFINEQNMDAAVRSIFEDKDGNLWFGNNGGGLFLYDGMVVVNFTEKHGLGNPDFMNNIFDDKPGTLARIWAIEQDDNGDMWFGTIDAGVWRYDGKRLINYTEKDGLSDQTINTIYKDKTGKLWFATNKGIFTFNGQSFDVFALFEGH